MSGTPATYNEGFSESSGDLNSPEIIGIANSLPDSKPTQALGMLFVTAFCHKDIGLLEKRLSWLAHLGVKVDRDILLVSDFDVLTDEARGIIEGHKKFFKNVFYQNILDPSPAQWPNNVNHVFRIVMQVLNGSYGKPFSWKAYQGWFYFEPDVTPLKVDSLQRLEQLYRDGRKPFCGFINATRTNEGGMIRHLNGAAVYPTKMYALAGKSIRNLYPPDAMLADSLPWDVAGLTNMNDFAPLDDRVYAHAFGTTNYRKDGNKLEATQTLMNGVKTEKTYILGDQVLHHGCKDGSLMDVLMGTTNLTSISSSSVVPTKEKEVMPSATRIPLHSTGLPVTAEVRPSAEAPAPKKKYGKKAKRKHTKEIGPIGDGLKSSVLADKASGMSWKQLMAKHKTNPRILKAIIG